MTSLRLTRNLSSGAWRGVALATLAFALQSAPAADAPGHVYKCPNNLYTDSISAKEAKDRGCKELEGQPVTVIQSVKPRAAAPVASGASGAKVDPAEQRARDSDARKILDDELRREEQRLAEMKAEYNNGQPERQGSEKNYQKYLDRVADMKSAIARKESDIAALKREIAKQPQ